MQKIYIRHSKTEHYKLKLFFVMVGIESGV